MKRRGSLYLEALLPVVWMLFLVWTGVAFLVIPFDLGSAQLREWIHHEALRAALERIFRSVDATWILLAAVNTYFILVANEGLATARRWSASLVFGSAVLATAGATAGFPFGPITYTGNLGFRIVGILPYTIPLLWLVTVVNARYLILAILPGASHWQRALGVGAVALLTDLNLEFVAWKVRAYWIWYPGNLNRPDWPPLQNYASWFVAGFLFSLLLSRWHTIAPGRRPVPAKALLILGLLNALYLGANIVRWLRIG